MHINQIPIGNEVLGKKLIPKIGINDDDADGGWWWRQDQGTLYVYRGKKCHSMIFKLI